MLLALHWPVVFVAVFVWYWRMGGSPLPLAWCVAYALWVLLKSPWRVRLLNDAVAVDWLGWSRRVRYDEIAGVSVEELKDVKAIDAETTGGVATVLLETTSGRVIKLADFKAGSFALYRSLDEAHKRGGPPR